MAEGDETPWQFHQRFGQRADEMDEENAGLEGYDSVTERKALLDRMYKPVLPEDHPNAKRRWDVDEGGELTFQEPEAPRQPDLVGSLDMGTRGQLIPGSQGAYRRIGPDRGAARPSFSPGNLQQAYAQRADNQRAYGTPEPGQMMGQQRAPGQYLGGRAAGGGTGVDPNDPMNQLFTLARSGNPHAQHAYVQMLQHRAAQAQQYQHEDALVQARGKNSEQLARTRFNLRRDADASEWTKDHQNEWDRMSAWESEIERKVNDEDMDPLEATEMLDRAAPRKAQLKQRMENGKATAQVEARRAMIDSQVGLDSLELKRMDEHSKALPGLVAKIPMPDGSIRHFLPLPGGKGWMEIKPAAPEKQPAPPKFSPEDIAKKDHEHDTKMGTHTYDRANDIWENKEVKKRGSGGAKPDLDEHIRAAGERRKRYIQEEIQRQQDDVRRQEYPEGNQEPPVPPRPETPVDKWFRENLPMVPGQEGHRENLPMVPGQEGHRENLSQVPAQGNPDVMRANEAATAGPAPSDPAEYDKAAGEVFDTGRSPATVGTYRSEDEHPFNPLQGQARAMQRSQALDDVKEMGQVAKMMNPEEAKEYRKIAMTWARHDFRNMSDDQFSAVLKQATPLTHQLPQRVREGLRQELNRRKPKE